MMRFKVWHNGNKDKPSLCVEYRIKMFKHHEQDSEAMHVIRQSVANIFTQITGVQCFCATAMEN